VCRELKMSGLTLRFFFIVSCFTLFDCIKCFYAVELLEPEFIDNGENRLMKNVKVFRDIESKTE